MKRANEVERNFPINKSRKCFHRGQWGHLVSAWLQNDSSTWLHCFSFNKYSPSEWCIVATQAEGFALWLLIYISDHYSTALCIQMSLNVFRSLLQQHSHHLSILQIQLILLMPPGLNQYAWIKVSVINTQVVFQETLSFSGAWFVPE